MTLSFEELKTSITPDNAETLILDYLESQGFTATSWASDDPITTMVKAYADLDSRRSVAQAYFALNRFNGTATDRDIMAEIARSDFDNEVNPAVTAKHVMRFSLVSTSAPVVLSVGSVQVSTSDGLTTFSLIVGGTVPTGSYIDLTVEADIAGSAGNAGLNTITNMVTSFAGVSCTNPFPPTQVGQNEESIEAIRLRNRQKWATLSIENTNTAIQYLIKTLVPTITSVSIDDQNPRGAGTVDIYCAADLAVSGPGDVAAAQVVARARFFNADPRIQAFPATPVNATFGGDILYSQTIGVALVQASVELALSDLLTATPIGGRSYQNGGLNVLLMDEVVDVVRSAEGVISFTPSTLSNIYIGAHRKLIPPVVWAIDYAPTLVS